MEPEISKVIWNLDDERLKNLEYYLEGCEQAIFHWNLEPAFSFLNQLVMIMSGKLSIPEFDECEKKLNSINQIRSKMDNSSKNFEHDRIILAKEERDLYIYLTRCLVKHGLYFRGSAKSGDSSLMN